MPFLGNQTDQPTDWHRHMRGVIVKFIIKGFERSKDSFENFHEITRNCQHAVHM